MIRIKFELTESQEDQLKPLFDAATEAHGRGQAFKGMILLRLSSDCPSEAVFLPHKYSDQIRGIMETFKEETGS